MAVQVIQENDVKSVRNLTELLNNHQRSLAEVQGSITEMETRIGRMLPEAERALKNIDDTARTRVSTIGDEDLLNRQMFREYVREDGTLRLFTEKRSVDLPWGGKAEFKLRGILSDTPKTKEQYLLQRAYAAYSLGVMTYDAFGAEEATNALRTQAYLDFYRAVDSFEGPVGNALRAELKRAMSNASGTGSEWVFSPQGKDIIRPMDMARGLVALIPSRPMTSASFTRPQMAGNTILREDAAGSDDPATRVAPSSFTTSTDTVTTVNMSLLTHVFLTWLRDVAPLLGDGAGIVLDWLQRQVAASIEIGIIHGDTNASPIDTGRAGWTLNSWFSAGVLSGSNTIVSKWLGLRRRAYDLSTTNNSAGTFDATLVAGNLSRMGVWGSDNNQVFVCGLTTLYEKIITSANFLTVDKAGPLATINTGSIGFLMGRPLIISQFLNKDMNASGVYDDTTKTKQILLGFNPNAYALFIREQGSFDVQRPDKNVRTMGLTFSGVFTHTCKSTETPVSVDYNL